MNNLNVVVRVDALQLFVFLTAADFFLNFGVRGHSKDDAAC